MTLAPAQAFLGLRPSGFFRPSVLGLRISSSVPLQFVLRWKLGKLLVRLHLIPKSDGGEVVLQRQVAAARLPAQGLNRYFQILLESNRIHDVPPIQAKPLLRIVEAVWPDDLRQPAVGRAELGVMALAVRPAGVEVIRTAKVV